MRLYVEFDQRSGWALESQVVRVMQAEEHISEGRTYDAISLLKSYRMLDERTGEAGNEIKISSFGVEWMDKTCPLISRNPTYEFSLPAFGKIKLVGPDTFYGRRKSSPKSDGAGINWTKWGAVAAIIAIPIPFLLWWLS